MKKNIEKLDDDEENIDSITQPLYNIQTEEFSNLEKTEPEKNQYLFVN